MKWSLPLAIWLIAGAVSADPMRKADVVFLGEIHDNAAAHLGQSQAITQITPTAVVFEMLTPNQAAAAQEVTLSEIADATDWANSGWPDFAIYEPIFAALGEATIYGAGTERAEAMAVFENGAADTFGAEAAVYGLTHALPPDQQSAREDLQFTAHCDAMPREMMGKMVEVQRYRDALLAAVAYDALLVHGPPVVVVTGSGHARIDWGAPAVLRAAHPDVTVFAQAFVEADNGTPFDAITIVSAADRDDPCIAFQSGRRE